jgi:tRNA-splicing ligase RtcB
MHIESEPMSNSLPIRYYLTPDLMPDAATLASLSRLARARGLAHYVAVLPDIHLKGRNPSPTGTVVAAKDAIIPRAVDTGINCGIRMIRTEIDVRALAPNLLDEMFAGLMRAIPVSLHDHDVIQPDEVIEILADSAAWSRRRYGLSDQELDCIEGRGRMTTVTEDADTIRASVPERARKKGTRCLGTLGAGNHFLELQEIVEILDPVRARQLGLERGKAFFMLHTGSRNLGSRTMKAINDPEGGFGAPAGANGSPFWSVPAASENGALLSRAIGAASNFGFANRIAITEALRGVVREVFHDPTLRLPLLYDCAHVSIKRERWNGDWLWVHRHGASRALPPSQFSTHPIFSQTGQPVPVPGSMGDDSFVGVGDERAVDAFCSVNHGAGRVLDKPDAVAHYTESMVESEMRRKHIRLYRYGSGDIAEQAPGAFKSISRVINAMSTLSLARPVVRLRPVAVLKG